MKPDKLNLIATVLGALMSFVVMVSIPLMVHAYKADQAEQTATLSARADAATATLRQESTVTFETKADHATDIGKLLQWNVQIQENEKASSAKMDDLRLNIQKLTDAIQNGSRQTAENRNLANFGNLAHP